MIAYHLVHNLITKYFLIILKRFRESVNVDGLCNGRLCPRRMHFGLLVIHAWTPNSKNSITADHVVYNFVRLKELEKNDDLDAAENAHEKNLAIDSVLTPKGIPSYFLLNTNLAKIFVTLYSGRDFNIE